MSRFSIYVMLLAAAALIIGAIEPAQACDTDCQFRGTATAQVMLIDAVYKSIAVMDADVIASDTVYDI